MYYAKRLAPRTVFNGFFIRPEYIFFFFLLRSPRIPRDALDGIISKTAGTRSKGAASQKHILFSLLGSRVITEQP